MRHSSEVWNGPVATSTVLPGRLGMWACRALRGAFSYVSKDCASHDMHPTHEQWRQARAGTGAGGRIQEQRDCVAGSQVQACDKPIEPGLKRTATLMRSDQCRLLLQAELSSAR